MKRTSFNRNRKAAFLPTGVIRGGFMEASSHWICYFAEWVYFFFLLFMGFLVRRADFAYRLERKFDYSKCSQFHLKENTAAAAVVEKFRYKVNSGNTISYSKSFTF
ncbi:hypothetical protein CDAR_241351 [Caerostris darwini]|uniref:ATP synthase F0 subunit 8 n=1 Tax=Caerostris darwini TaxID=1538125 RepID=A0AAV4TLT9_9ARAC|nr:hypothetical protein CDAR_241351 [Caerostris darwini]